MREAREWNKKREKRKAGQRIIKKVGDREREGGESMQERRGGKEGLMQMMQRMKEEDRWFKGQEEQRETRGQMSICIQWTFLYLLHDLPFINNTFFSSLCVWTGIITHRRSISPLRRHQFEPKWACELTRRDTPKSSRRLPLKADNLHHHTWCSDLL